MLYDLTALDRAPHVEWELLPDLSSEIPGDVASRYDALFMATSVFSVTRSTLKNADRLTVIARAGAGFENIDIESCTAKAIVVASAPDSVRGPMATAAIGFLLALSLKMMKKDQLVREGRWAEGSDHLGDGLVGRTFGLVGLGNIGREILRLARPFGMRHLAYDPFVDVGKHAHRLRVEAASLDDLLRLSDFVCIACPLTDATWHLLDARKLSLLKRSAYLINIARGPVVDQEALGRLLAEGLIAGAALDVFEKEPVDPADPLLRLENTIFSPHAIGWTHDYSAIAGNRSTADILAVARGSRPRFMINSAVLRDPRFRTKLRSYRQRFFVDDRA